jgi:pyrimidine-nucleoside phosphorylase
VSLLPQESIRKKRGGGALSAPELKAFFYGYLEGQVADYQMGAMLMAITLKGMTPVETADLTKLMRDSGEVMTWGFPRHRVVDKHSTGGVGDKTSIVLLPLMILTGLKVPMMAGRGLGHTGGTLDKLEAVGFKVYMPPDAARRQVEQLGGVIMGQTEKIAPLDRKLYSLRDVTATIESIPLIVGSILSKKLAEGIGNLVMDVKYGSGAFMANLDDAKVLAAELTRVGKECGINVRSLITSMNTPLGRAAGNALEIKECLETLQGQGPSDTRELTIELGAEMLKLAEPDTSIDAARQRLAGYLDDGSAYEAFLRVARAQGADMTLLEQPARLDRAKLKLPVTVPVAGHVAKIDVRQLGLSIIELGGGRRLVTDKVDPWVGLTDMKRLGEPVAAGEPIAIVHANDEAAAKQAAALVASAYTVGREAGSDTLIAARM